eukprot:scaffold72310_cov24-Prasinocladus_malaysianus.AAC.2
MYNNYAQWLACRAQSYSLAGGGRDAAYNIYFNHLQLQPCSAAGSVDAVHPAHVDAAVLWGPAADQPLMLHPSEEA